MGHRYELILHLGRLDFESLYVNQKCMFFKRLAISNNFVSWKISNKFKSQMNIL